MLVFGMRCVGMGAEMQALSNSAALIKAKSGLLEMSELMTLSAEMTRAGDPDAAIKLYRAWILTPLPDQAGFVFVALFNLGVTLGSKGDDAGAEQAYRDAIAVNPEFLEARLNLGSVLERQGRPAEAIDCWRQLVGLPVALLPAQQDLLLKTLNQLGRLWEVSLRYAEAETALRRSLEIDPQQPDVLQHWQHLRQRQCIWPVALPFGEVSAYSLLMSHSTLSMLAAHDDPALQLLAARSYVARKLPPAPAALSAGRRYHHPRLRVGYLSGDLCTHAVGLLLADLFEQHDRSRVEVFAFCHSVEDGSAYRQRLKSAFEHFESLSHLSDAQAAQRILDCEIDVLVDLHGLSAGMRQGILALRPAPVQVTWLGFIGTTALPWIDYVIADRYALPASLQSMFSEQVLYLDPCFLPGDRRRELGPSLTRTQAGLPEAGFVFASFNNAYKLNPVMFDCWLRILRAVPGSVLWLLDDNPGATANLAAFAAGQGLAPDRLVFAPRVTTAAYRARLALADLFLDNHPYNAGSTANDVLWMGVPMLTLSGRSFVSRMGGSLLNALGLPELVTHSHLQYEETATALAHDPDRLRAIRDRLQCARYDSPAFDMTRLAGALEGLLEKAAGRGA